jgi:large subunit ribosomal protein L18e
MVKAIKRYGFMAPLILLKIKFLKYSSRRLPVELKSTNQYLRMTVRFLEVARRQYNVGLWATVAVLLSRPRRGRVVVNVGELNRLLNDGDVVVVPGKVLGDGELSKRVTVAAWSFSRTALMKIKAAGGEALSIPELVRRMPKPSGVKIIT